MERKRGRKKPKISTFFVKACSEGKEKRDLRFRGWCLPECFSHRLYGKKKEGEGKEKGLGLIKNRFNYFSLRN